MGPVADPRGPRVRHDQWDVYAPTMFTGLVQAMGTISGIAPQGPGCTVRIDFGAWPHRPQPGDSISVDGCCLTVVEFDGGIASFNAVRETLDRTTLGSRAVGDRVNLEHALRADALMGGHVVQGHVDGVGEVAAVRTDGGDAWIDVRPPAALMEFMVPKGSIAIDGVSLTLAAVGRETVGVALVPSTLAATTLGAMRPGRRVNIEADVLAKTVVHWMRNFRENGTRDPR